MKQLGPGQNSAALPKNKPLEKAHKIANGPVEHPFLGPTFTVLANRGDETVISCTFYEYTRSAIRAVCCLYHQLHLEFELASHVSLQLDSLSWIQALRPRKAAIRPRGTRAAGRVRVRVGFRIRAIIGV